jgi:hypothetical protein
LLKTIVDPLNEYLPESDPLSLNAFAITSTTGGGTPNPALEASTTRLSNPSTCGFSARVRRFIVVLPAGGLAGSRRTRQQPSSALAWLIHDPSLASIEAHVTADRNDNPVDVAFVHLHEPAMPGDEPPSWAHSRSNDLAIDGEVSCLSIKDGRLAVLHCHRHDRMLVHGRIPRAASIGRQVLPIQLP